MLGILFRKFLSFWGLSLDPDEALLAEPTPRVNGVCAHGCEEFTSWETKEFTRTPSDVELYQAGYTNKTSRDAAREGYRIMKRWQERRCTLCGKLYQETLMY